MNSHYIYFAQIHFTDRVKVGRTRDLHLRIKMLRAACKAEVELQSVIRTHNRYAEQIFHRLLERRNINGEWFTLEYGESERVIDHFLKHERSLTRDYMKWRKTRPERRKSDVCVQVPNWLNRKRTA